MGIVGLETAFPLLYTYLVQKQKLLTLPQLIRLMHDNPSTRFGIGSPLEPGQPADLTVFDLDAESVIDPEMFLSKGHSTPFARWRVQGLCKLTL
jgi:dihydroorotase